MVGQRDFILPLFATDCGKEAKALRTRRLLQGFMTLFASRGYVNFAYHYRDCQAGAQISHKVRIFICRLPSQPVIKMRNG
jgi:hypothetical protein